LSLFAFFETVIFNSNCEIFLTPWFASELLVIN
jgi:hypothetical protein